LLGVKQLIIGVNKMDCDVAKYGKDRYDEIKAEGTSMLAKLGWKKDFIAKSVPVLPISGWIGDNLIEKSAKMAWWEGQTVTNLKGVEMKVVTLADVLEKFVVLPERADDKIFRMPVSGVYKIKGVGDVITGRVEQGSVKPGDEVKFLPTNTSSKACTGKIFSVEMHHKSVESAGTGDNVGLNVKNLAKENMPRAGDVMIMQKDDSLKACKNFTAQVQILDHPGELKVGYSPIAFIRTGRSAVRMEKIDWKIGKETGGSKAADPACLKANEMAQVVFAPVQPFVADTFKKCEGLGRVAIMEGNGVVMLGKVCNVEFVVDVKK